MHTPEWPSSMMFFFGSEAECKAAEGQKGRYSQISIHDGQLRTLPKWALGTELG